TREAAFDRTSIAVVKEVIGLSSADRAKAASDFKELCLWKNAALHDQEFRLDVRVGQKRFGQRRVNERIIAARVGLEAVIVLMLVRNLRAVLAAHFFRQADDTTSKLYAH